MAERKQDFNIEVGSGVVGIFARVPAEKINLFAEFVDNSLQSFLDHKDEIDTNCCHVNITWTDDEIIIEDDAFGMNQEEFGNAVRFNAPAKQYSENSLGKYGVGLKTAAARLGSWYSIETTAYKSKEKYYATIDIDDLQKNNPKTLSGTISDIDENVHYTKIVIRKLREKRSSKLQDELISQLGRFYADFLTDREPKLEIAFNNMKVINNEPEWAKDVETGNDMFEVFKNSFFVENKEYEYMGVIGILKKGGYDKTGLDLRRNKRTLQLLYRPTELFGKGGTYKNLKVYGIIEFIGDNWVVQVNKDGVVWGVGLKEQFLKSLNSDQNVKKILRSASKRSKKEQKCKIILNLPSAGVSDCSLVTNKTYKMDDEIDFSLTPQTGYQIKEVRVNNKKLLSIEGRSNAYNFKVDKTEMRVKVSVTAGAIVTMTQSNYTEKPIPSLKQMSLDASSVKVEDSKRLGESYLKEKIEARFKHLENEDFPICECTDRLDRDIDEKDYVVKFKNEKFSFNVSFVGNDNEKGFLKIKEKPAFYNAYSITIDLDVIVYRNIPINDQIREVFIIQAISIALASIKAKRLGASISDFKTFLNAMNDIMQ